METSAPPPKSRALLQRVSQSAVVWTFFANLLRFGSSLLVLPLVWRYLPPEQLGLWYVFVTLSGLAALLDFGFEPTVTRLTAYAWGGARRFVAFGVENEPGHRQPNRLLLGELVATLRAYYFRVGVGVLLLLTTGGSAWIWHITAPDAEAGVLRAAWIAYSVGCCLGFINGRWPALLIGIGALKAGQQVRILSQLIYCVVAMAGLLGGFGLWAMVGAIICMSLGLWFFGQRTFRLRAELPTGLPAARFHPEIFSAIWPNAWRMGLVTFGAFCIQQANTLICSGYLGLTATASYGMSVQLAGVLVGLSSIWIQVKLPLINQMRVQGRGAEIIAIFIPRMRLTLLTYLVGAGAIFYLAPIVLQLVGSKTELLAPAPLAVLLLIYFLETNHGQYAQLVFTENRNPFLKPALISGAAIILLSLLFTPRYGIWGMLIPVGVVQASFNNWWPVLLGIRGLGLSPHCFFRRMLQIKPARNLSA